MKKFNTPTKPESAKSVESKVCLPEELDDRILQGIAAGAVPPKP